MHDVDLIRFAVVNDQDESIWKFCRKDDYIGVMIEDGPTFVIDPTQATELGALFIALGGGNIQLDDVNELLDGYDESLYLNILNDEWSDE